VIWRAIHSAVGLVVTLIQISSLRSIRTITKPYEFEANGRDHEQVHGGNVWAWVRRKDDEELVDRVLLAKSDPLRAAFWSWLPRWIV
jgi:hypothetical protein